jgi:hypothetical protein
MNMALDERTKIFDKVCRLVATKHFDPGMNGVDWNALARERRDQILECADPEVFEKEFHKLVAELKTSHTGFRHAGMRNIPAQARHGAGTANVFMRDVASRITNRIQLTTDGHRAHRLSDLRSQHLSTDDAFIIG